MRRGQPGINLSEGLAGVPGLQIQNRQNYAQDLQISSRGFGARSTFGVRGVRLYVDGIPATMPDGQGQTSNIDIGSIDRVEVLRGPFSALYGNSSGGVIQVYTEDGTPPPTLSASGWGGSDGTWRYGVKASGGEPGGLDYVLDASRFTTDGYRDHSGERREGGGGGITLRHDNGSIRLYGRTTTQKLELPGPRLISPSTGVNEFQDAPRGDRRRHAVRRPVDPREETQRPVIRRFRRHPARPEAGREHRQRALSPADQRRPQPRLRR
ncbi:hypothetical protein G6F68_012018 [Rhizopus microsporus]|nr:hypothetical protein G6F68_012018 [Rhizopus microsporus]